MQHWERVEGFVQVVRHGSFVAAAKHLHISSSHISRLVSRLEQQLGTQLLYRSTRQIQLTDAGRIYYEACRQLFEGVRTAELQLQQHQGLPTGELKITAPATFGDNYIAPLMNDFHTRHPQLSVTMYFSNRQVELIEEGFDVGIRMGVLRESTLIARRLCDRREYIVGSPEYLSLIAAPQTLTDLERHNCLLGSRGYWLLQHNGQRKEINVRGNWHANSGPALLDAALKGLGLAQLPDYYVDASLASGKLVSVLDEYQSPDMGVWIVYPQQRHLAPKVRLLIDFLVEQFRGGIPEIT